MCVQASNERRLSQWVVGTVVQSNGGDSLSGVCIKGTRWINDAFGFNVQREIQADPKGAQPGSLHDTCLHTPHQYISVPYAKQPKCTRQSSVHHTTQYMDDSIASVFLFRCLWSSYAYMACGHAATGRWYQLAAQCTGRQLHIDRYHCCSLAIKPSRSQITATHDAKGTQE